MSNPSGQSRASEWLPIETAPKDTEVLVFMPGEGRMGRIHRGIQAKISNGHIWMIGHHFAYDLSPPTHWMPLPDPPEPHP